MSLGTAILEKDQGISYPIATDSVHFTMFESITDFSTMRLFLFSFCILTAHIMLSSDVDTTDITFTGAAINPYAAEYDTSGKLVFSGYVDAYFASYTDANSGSPYVKFPTVCARNRQFGLNIVQASARYQSNRFRGTATLFTGDCASSAWSVPYNAIQEANLGFRIAGKLWLDAGFFRTHIGLESIQPRENMTLSLASTTYFEPYFLSGAKLTWQHSDKFTLQINAFNSFNQYVETNRNKAVGLSIGYNPDSHTSIAFSSICSDELQVADASPRHLRVYNNLCITRRTARWVLGLEGNYGLQQRTGILDQSSTAYMASALAACKFRITPQWAVYGRGEFFHDPNEILTGPIYNENHSIVGAELAGATLGFEFKPIPNSYLRAEARGLHERSERIFEWGDGFSSDRLEVLVGLGVWF
jgi:hypothetical protein